MDSGAGVMRGTKRICHSCEARYYDLGRDPPTCPTCGVVYNPEALLKSRHRTVQAKAPAVQRSKPAAVVEDDRLPPVEDEDEVVAVSEDEGAVEVAEDELLEGI